MVIADDVVRVPRMRADERRGQLVLVAARQFHRRGYHGVSLGSVAMEVGLTGPALYRHFHNKQALLAAAIASGLNLVENVLLRKIDSTLDQLVAAITSTGLERPDLWVLLQRDSHYLDPDLRLQVDAQFTRIIDALVARARLESPGLADEEARLLVTAATAVLSLPATVSPVLPRVAYHRELAAAALACLRTDLRGLDRGHECAVTLAVVDAPAEATRKSAIVDAAVSLFYLRGFAGVSLDDIGAAMGMAGPSILHHFDTKSDILVAAFDRATTTLAAERERLNAAMAELPDRVDSYVRFCLRNRELIGVYVCDAMNLPEDALDRTRAVIRDDVTDWTVALCREAAALEERRAKVRVQAAMGAVHDLVRLGRFTSRPHIVSELHALASAIMLRRAPQ